MTEPEPLSALQEAERAAVRYLLTDIDDTISTGGLITSEAFGALWALADAGVRVVPVTGRPAGWCDHIARMWPVAGVIGENGAFVFRYDRRSRTMHREYLISEQERLEGRRRLEAVRRRALLEVPGCRVAADQPFRLVDLAIDYREDAGPLDAEAVARICRIATEEGATAKVSSIHINCWYGLHTKLTGVEAFLRGIGACAQGACAQGAGAPTSRADALDPGPHCVAFVGDSPNDEPLFARLPLSVGVANIRPFLAAMTHPPRYITSGAAGAGFAELARLLVDARQGNAGGSAR